MPTYAYSGRSFSRSEISRIIALTKHMAHTSRRQISLEVCRRLGWVGENGKPKAWVCREFLLILERDGFLRLPQPKPWSRNRFKKKNLEPPFIHDRPIPLAGRIDEFQRPLLTLVQSPEMNALWDAMTNTYHDLGFRGIPGRFLKYFADLQDLPVAALGWGGSAWHVACRDRYMGWDDAQRRRLLGGVLNNFRFTIFPWVKIHHLASCLLAQGVQRAASDWQRRYRIPVVLFETFIEKGRFAGACYQAANWVKVGETSGFRKRKTGYQRHRVVKDVYLFEPRKRTAPVVPSLQKESPR